MNYGYEEVYDMNNLFDALHSAMKGSSWKEQVQKYNWDRLSNLTELHNELKNKTYRKSKGSEFTLNERGKIRYIHGSIVKDRVVQHSFSDNILFPLIKPLLIHNNGASQKGKGITFQRTRFENDLHRYYIHHNSNEGYIGLIDLSKFYDNIRHDKIKELIHPLLDDDEIWLLDCLLEDFEVDVSYMSEEEFRHCLDQKYDSIKYHETVSKEQQIGEKMMKKSVNIGDQISQDIGIFFPTKIDNYVKIVRGCKYYGRYMDDMYVIGESKEYIASLIEGITAVADELGLFINPKKTRICKLSDNYKFLQVRYSLTETGRLIKRINPKSVARERRKLKAYKRLLDREVLTYDAIENCYKSWMGSFVRIMSKKQIKHMKQLFKDLFGKEPRWKT